MKEQSIELDTKHRWTHHHREKSNVEGIDLHAFIYFISISNLQIEALLSEEENGFLANDDGTKTVVEGEKIVGESPTFHRVKLFLTIVIM